MSLINDMLRNLEQRHAAEAPLPNEVRPLPAEKPGLAWQPIAAVLAVAAVGGVAFLALREAIPPDAPLPVAAITPRPQTPAPAAAMATVPTPAVTPVPVPDLPAPVSAAPAAAAVAAAPPAAVRRSPPPETLRLATSLPSLERIKPKTGDTAGAAAASTQTIEKSFTEPDPAVQAEADLRRARELLGQGKRGEAETYFKQGLARLPAQTEAAMTLARLQVDRGDLGGAWETLQRSLPHAQQHAGYRAFCGTVLQRLNRSREAVEHYQAALRLNPAEGRWWVGLGIALEGAGQAGDAREAYQRARASGNLPPEMAVFAEQKSR